MVQNDAWEEDDIAKSWRGGSHVTNTIGIRNDVECSGSHGVFPRRNYYVETGRRVRRLTLIGGARPCPLFSACATFKGHRMRR